MSNAEAIGQRNNLHHSKFIARYSIFLQKAWQVNNCGITDRGKIG